MAATSVSLGATVVPDAMGAQGSPPNPEAAKMKNPVERQKMTDFQESLRESAKEKGKAVRGE